MYRATAARRRVFAGLFGWGELQRLAAICDEEGQPLEFGVDVNAARYVDGRRETPNGEVWRLAAGLQGLHSARLQGPCRALRLVDTIIGQWMAAL